jgi:hypothetical protein
MVDVMLELNDQGDLIITPRPRRLPCHPLRNGADYFTLTDQERKHLLMGCRVLTSVREDQLEIALAEADEQFVIDRAGWGKV